MKILNFSSIGRQKNLKLVDVSTDKILVSLSREREVSSLMDVARVMRPKLTGEQVRLSLEKFEAKREASKGHSSNHQATK